jgi:hypothetical protein
MGMGYKVILVDGSSCVTILNWYNTGKEKKRVIDI